MLGFRKITLNTFYQIGGRVVSSGVSFLITLFIAQKMGVGIYSDYAKITAYVSLFYLFADFGLNAIFLQREKAYYKHLFYLRILMCVGIIVISDLISILLPYNAHSAIGFSNSVKFGIFLFSFTIFTEGILNSSLALFQRNLIYKYSFISTAIGSLATLVCLILFTFYSNSLFGILVAFLIGAVIESGLSVFFAKEKILPIEFDLEFSKGVIKESYPIALMLVFNLIYFRADMLILSSLKPSLDVAVYNLAYSFFDFLIAIPLFLSNVLYVSILRDVKTLNIKKINKYLLTFIAFSLPITIFIFIASPLLRYIKESFELSSLALRILVSFLPVFFMTSILQWILIALKKQRFLAHVYLWLALINIVLNYIFIPSYSFVASAIITGVCETIVLILLYFKLWREVKYVKS